MNKKVVSRLKALRRKMAEQGIDMYMVVSADFHGSEYVSEYFQCRQWISGFDGSAGTVLVGKDFAGLWTDGRYFLQAQEQLEGTGITLFKMGVEGVPSVKKYIETHIREGGCLGYDGRTIGVIEGREYEQILAGKNGYVKGNIDLIHEIWAPGPIILKERAWLLDVRYAGQSRDEKILAVRQDMADEGADCLVITSLDEIAWLLNIRGNDIEDNPVILSYMILEHDLLRLYVNDWAFSEDDIAELEKSGIELRGYNDIYRDVAGLKADKVWYDGAALNSAILSAMPKDIKTIDKTSPIKLRKAIKNNVEIDNIRRAHIKDGIALTKFMYWLKTNIGRIAMTELNVGARLEELRMEQEGYLEPSFEPICGYGPHAAIIHYSATPKTNVPLEAKGLLLMDTGGHYMEGTTDVTRTHVLGEISDDERRIFTLVLRGHLNLAGAKFRYGCQGVNLDYLAREPLWQNGMDYNHGTGHGVGFLLNVHEGPNSFRWKSLPNRKEDCILEEGMITSNEPGMYFDGRFGVRHEDLILCKKAEKNEYGQFMCFETLTMTPFDLDGIDASLMTDRERWLLNDYHKKVRENIGPYLEDNEREWLNFATREV